ncbi:putative esterase [Rippkaea orientalis PCC 8801]|uniref:Putative esterase n=1 Tax=Rippkaea orientalis (strain PCC 8801 / RF-1) TaxID=41431 RepID=B7K5X9_RIPO1|nr:alpha/beta hydrolase-fold protein [Rippkaea orientalis]ACK68032.1 putative esterase [Rippkaea orientalis PCC 8801]
MDYLRKIFRVILIAFIALYYVIAANADITVSSKDTSQVSWVTKAVSASGVHFRTFKSKAAGTMVSYHVYSPPIYNRNKTLRLPVLYWLHGTGGGVAGIARLSALFDRAIQDGKIPPMLVVFPNGLATSMWSNSKDGKVPMETVVVKELVPLIDSSYRTIAKREGRLIEGFSMGGYGAARLGLKYPEVFGSVSILAGGPFDINFQGPRARNNPIQRENILRHTFGGDMEYFRAQNPYTLAKQYAAMRRGRLIIRMVVGDRDFTAPDNRSFSELLDRLQIEHSYNEVPGVGHNPITLFEAFGESNWMFYRKIFGKVASSASTTSSLFNR